MPAAAASALPPTSTEWQAADRSQGNMNGLDMSTSTVRLGNSSNKKYRVLKIPEGHKTKGPYLLDEKNQFKRKPKPRPKSTFGSGDRFEEPALATKAGPGFYEIRRPEAHKYHSIINDIPRFQEDKFQTPGVNTYDIPRVLFPEHDPKKALVKKRPMSCPRQRQTGPGYSNGSPSPLPGSPDPATHSLQDSLEVSVNISYNVNVVQHKGTVHGAMRPMSAHLKSKGRGGDGRSTHGKTNTAAKARPHSAHVMTNSTSNHNNSHSHSNGRAQGQGGGGGSGGGPSGMAGVKHHGTTGSRRPASAHPLSKGTPQKAAHSGHNICKVHGTQKYEKTYGGPSSVHAKVYGDRMRHGGDGAEMTQGEGDYSNSFQRTEKSDLSMMEFTLMSDSEGDAAKDKTVAFQHPSKYGMWRVPENNCLRNNAAYLKGRALTTSEAEMVNTTIQHDVHGRNDPSVFKGYRTSFGTRPRFPDQRVTPGPGDYDPVKLNLKHPQYEVKSNTKRFTHIKTKGPGPADYVTEKTAFPTTSHNYYLHLQNIKHMQKLQV
eukprot:GFYU01001483.1.p1 GENE.GFYU01001483.1~~GFYU01001483.1.p1  ORF type:complete len:542 (-),score=73.35 GFYU01001483.1:249-1874(-)